MNKPPRVEVPAGSLVFGQGEPGGSLLLIEEGQVELSRSFLGGDVVLRTLGPGAPLGVGSFQGEEPREATARAVVDTKLLRFDAKWLASHLREQSDLALTLLAGVAAQLTAADSERRPDEVSQLWPATDPPTRPVLLADLPASATAVVTALLWHASGTSFALPDQGEVILGRAHLESGFFPELDLGALPEGRSVSRQHARLVVLGDKILVREDRSARNGTFVNGVRIAPELPVELPDNARLRLGLVELRLLRSRDD